MNKKGVTGRETRGNRSSVSKVNETEPVESASGSADEAWQCYVCEKLFASDNDKVLECDGGCKHYFCTKCIDMPDSCYDTLQRPDCFWYCRTCVLMKKH